MMCWPTPTCFWGALCHQTLFAATRRWWSHLCHDWKWPKKMFCAFLSCQSSKGEILEAFAKFCPHNLVGCGPLRQRTAICNFKLKFQEVVLRKDRKETEKDSWLKKISSLDSRDGYSFHRIYVSHLMRKDAFSFLLHILFGGPFH